MSTCVFEWRLWRKSLSTDSAALRQDIEKARTVTLYKCTGRDISKLE